MNAEFLRLGPAVAAFLGASGLATRGRTAGGLRPKKEFLSFPKAGERATEIKMVEKRGDTQTKPTTAAAAHPNEATPVSIYFK